LERALKIFRKGQITLPKRVREALKTDFVRVVVEEGSVRIVPVRDVAVGLRKYAKRCAPLREVKDQAWDEAVREKHLRH
jgi:bifunctional DNA-binding transcriptional regulator/antitoxin component of YhaV-PrlF toxin-antitoxin module